MSKILFFVFFFSLCVHIDNGNDVSIKLHTGPFLRPGELFHAEAIVNWTRPGGSPAVPVVVEWLKDGKQICLSNQTFVWPARTRCTGFDLRVLRLTQKDTGSYCVAIQGGESPSVHVYVRRTLPQTAVPTARNNPSTKSPMVSDSGKNDPSYSPLTTWQMTVKSDAKSSPSATWQATVPDETQVTQPSSAGSCYHTSWSVTTAVVAYIALITFV